MLTFTLNINFEAACSEFRYQNLCSAGPATVRRVLTAGRKGSCMEPTDCRWQFQAMLREFYLQREFMPPPRRGHSV